MFKELQVLERASRGLLVEKVEDSDHPTEPLANEPFCTNSEILSYTELDGTLVANAHRYYREDGTIGLSGKPDPKKIVKDGILYILVV